MVIIVLRVIFIRITGIGMNSSNSNGNDVELRDNSCARPSLRQIRFRTPSSQCSGWHPCTLLMKSREAQHGWFGLSGWFF